MTASIPQRGLQNVMASMPTIWREVTPDDSDYLMGDASSHEVAVALLSADGGIIHYKEPGSTDDLRLVFAAGQVIPGAFTRVMSTNTTSTVIFAAFMTPFGRSV